MEFTELDTVRFLSRQQCSQCCRVSFFVVVDNTFFSVQRGLGPNITAFYRYCNALKVIPKYEKESVLDGVSNVL